MGQIQQINRLHGELVAAGVRFDGVDSDGNISGLNPADASLAALVITARDKGIASAECQAVKAAVGAASAQWTAYQAVRNINIDTERLGRYVAEVLIMITQLFYTARYNNDPNGKIAVFNAQQLTDAKTRIDQIRAELPYLP